jgi:Beta-lactamase superfamily domain
VRFVTLGVGAQASPRYAPAGLLVAHAGVRVIIDGGPGAIPRTRLDAWLVTDERSELITSIRRMAKQRGLIPYAGPFHRGDLHIVDRSVVHTNHPTCGYQIKGTGITVVWAPEFYEFPRWARGADLMFAEAAAWNRPIRFAGGVGGHLDVRATAQAAKRHGITRLVFAHIGRPTLRALDRGLKPSFGEFARDGQIFMCGAESVRPVRGCFRPPGACSPQR